MRFRRSKFTNEYAEKVIYFLDCLGTFNEQDGRKSDDIEMTGIGKLDIKFGFQQEMILGKLKKNL